MALPEARSNYMAIPCGINWAALNDPQHSNDHVGYYQENDRSLQRSDQNLGNWYAKKETAYGNFGPHDGRKHLYPFAVGVFAEFLYVIVVQVEHRSPKAKVNFTKIHSNTDDASELLPSANYSYVLGPPYRCKKYGPVIPA